MPPGVAVVAAGRPRRGGVRAAGFVSARGRPGTCQPDVTGFGRVVGGHAMVGPALDGSVELAVRGAAARVSTLGASDCERLRDGLLAQPVNALSSLAYLAAGGWVAWAARRAEPACRRAAVAFGLTLALTGAGSADYHGPGSPAARWLHDLGIQAPLLFVAVRDLADAARIGPGGALGLQAAGVAAAGVTLALVPGSATALAVWLAGAVLAGEAVMLPRRLRSRRGRRGAWRADALAGAALACAGLLHVLGRSGGTLCDPDGVLQPHAAWHVLTAAALAAWARAALDGPEGGR
jgi:hypothetical protein